VAGTARRWERDGRLRAAWAVAGGLRLHARRSAAAPAGAPPLVLVHGFGVSGRYMVPLAERLAGELDVWVPDLPGHGRSEAPPRALTVPELAGALLAWMDAVGLERPALLGNSMGCQVLIDLAARRPDRVGPLVLVGPTVDRFHRSVAAQALRLVTTGLFERPSILGVLALDYARMLPRIAGELRAAMDDRPEAKARRVRARSVVVRGEHDLLTTMPWVTGLAARLRSEAVHVVPWWGHALNYSAPDALAPLVRAFLADAGVATGPRERPRVRRRGPRAVSRDRARAGGA
jgi:pimeloyl-ACP methyl ester carboxylesterase